MKIIYFAELIYEFKCGNNGQIILGEVRQIDRENGSVQTNIWFYINFVHYGYISAHTFTDLPENYGIPLLLWKGMPSHTKKNASS